VPIAGAVANVLAAIEIALATAAAVQQLQELYRLLLAWLA